MCLRAFRRLRPPRLTVPIDGVKPLGVMKFDNVLGKVSFSDSFVLSDSNELGLLFLFINSDALITVGGGSDGAEGLLEFTRVSILSRSCGFSRSVGFPPAGISNVLGKWVIFSELRLVFGRSSLSSKTRFF